MDQPVVDVHINVVDVMVALETVQVVLVDFGVSVAMDVRDAVDAKDVVDALVIVL